jgi:hypothetical protein
MTEPIIHLRASGILAICGAQLGPGETHPEEVNEETARIVNCPACRKLAIGPPNVEYRASNFLL